MENILDHTVIFISLYNPTTENLQCTIDKIEKFSKVSSAVFYLQDNTEKSGHSLEASFTRFCNVHYVSNVSNDGIAKPLNDSTKFGIKQGKSYLLAFDQDTIVEDRFISDLQNLGRLFDITNLAFIALITRTINTGKIYSGRSSITSGCIYRISHVKRCGGFDENLFIDSVDHDIEYRMKKIKLLTFYFNSQGAKHQLGELQSDIDTLFASTHHSALRRYYITRNLIYRIIYKRQNITLQTIAYHLIWLFNLHREKDIMCKIGATILGFRDGFVHKMGKR